LNVFNRRVNEKRKLKVGLVDFVKALRSAQPEAVLKASLECCGRCEIH